MTITVAYAQRGTGDWMTSAFDAQRSSWVRSDGKISLETLQKPGFEVVWKMKFDNQPRQLNTITPPALLDFYIGYRGFRALGFFGASADRVVAVDIDIARKEWEKVYAATTPSTGSLACPGGMTSAVTRPTGVQYAALPSGRGTGRGTPAKSGVGRPYEGAITIKPPSATPPPARPVAATKPPPPDLNSPFAPRIQYVLALTGDGKLHSLWVSNGEEKDPAPQFVPAGAHALGLIAYGGTAYVATTNGCNGTDNGVWALDLTTRKVTQWKTGNKGVAGSAGPAAGPDGTLYVAGGDGVLTALAPKTLEPLRSYKADGVGFTSSPVVFDFKGKNLIAVTSSDGRLHLLDSATLNGSTALAKTEPFSQPNYQAGSVTSWQDPSGTRWILAAAHASIAAFKVTEKEGTITLQPGWTSRELVSPLPPIVINGVVFALSSGEFRSADPQLSAAQRAQRSTHAILYALDPATGKDIWNSGNALTSFVHSGGLSAGGGRVYVATYEGTQYAFSFPMEH